MKLINLGLPSFELGEKYAQYLAILIAFFGIVLLFFWPLADEYEQIKIVRIFIAQDSKWILFEGEVQSVEKRTDGRSIRVCEEGSCINAYTRQETKGDWDANDKVYAKTNVRVWGEVSSYYSRKFVWAHKVDVLRVE